MDKVYVKVELERYEDLVIAEERLRALEEIIYKSTEYSEFRKELRISDDKPILNYLDSIDSYYQTLLRRKKEECEKENEE